MPNPTIPIQVAATVPPRNPPLPPGTPPPADKTFEAQSFVGSFAWGSAPGQATVVYVGDNAPVQTGALVTLRIGAHTFYGLCKSDTGATSARGGITRTLQYVDLREFLTWDYVFGFFNKPDIRLVNGVRKKRYMHLEPWSFDDYAVSYTDAPVTAAYILQQVFNAPTVGSPWVWDLTGNGEFTPLMNVPVYDFDFSSGERLDSVLNRLSAELGLVYGCLSIGQPAYKLVWTRKGYGSLTFPYNSDERRYGNSLSGNATNVRVLGDRNQYQFLDVTMVKDWQPAWEPFLTRDAFADDIFQRASDPVTGVRYNAIPFDTEQYQGRFKAAVRARTITVREYVALRAGSGAAFADTRLFTGRSRMDMPAALYIEALVFRAFKPSGLTLPEGWDISGRMICKVEHSLSTGGMTALPGQQADGNGLAVAKAYNVAHELFRSVKSDQFDLNAFNDLGNVWTGLNFQVDNSGEGTRFILFDEPVFTLASAADLLATINGHKVVKANFVFTVPTVKASLVFEGERFSYWQGTYPNVSRDLVVPAPGVHQEFVGNFASGAFTEIAYADGSYANDKALALANAALLRQYIYADGGFVNKWDPATPVAGFGTQLSSLVDRVQITISPEAGTVESVDFTTERQRDNFEPERDTDRKATLDVLFPGQAELRQEAEDFKKLGRALEQAPDLRKRLNDILTGGISVDPAEGIVWLPNAPVGTLPAGSIIRKKPMVAATYNLGTVGVHPTQAQSTDNILLGITLRQDENNRGSFRVANTGVVPCLVMGPVEANDTVGLPSTGVNYLVKDGSPSVGRVVQKIAGTPGTVALVQVQLGVGGASADRMFPFRVYQSPAPPGGTAYWKSVRVRAGAFWSETTGGTDGAANPDSDEIPDYSAADFVVTPLLGTNVYWVWLHRFGDGTSTIWHSYHPTQAPISVKWGSFPEPDGANLPIALITVDEDNQTLDIRQFLRTDALLLCTPP